MKVHHKLEHGESLKEFVECENCGEETYLPPSLKGQEKHFCSQSCQGDWRSGKSADEFGVSLSGELVECANCGVKIYKSPHRIELYDNHYCNERCMSEDYESRLSGDGNPRWEGGRERVYPHNWNDIRESVIERDGYKCDECGISRIEHIEKYEKDFHVHHIQSIVDGGTHNIDNLITLCIVCHPTVETNG